ncbi:MAG TPA: four helix bundle suffix domain-containing protein [bacterium]|nr:four helix bundle suffix domain-containing protein [bacterium]
MGQIPDRPRRLRPSGGFRGLRAFQAATVIYDATVDFCNRFVDKRSRTHDQMVQAARSGRQNLAEGSRAAATSSQTELRLTQVARGSLDELLLDYEDYLRQRGLAQWDKDDAEARAVRAVGLKHPTDRSEPTDQAEYAPWLSSPDPATVANALICLIHQTNYLLDRLTASMERDFIKGGGYSERLAAARIAERSRGKPASSAAVSPTCPRCGKPMALRTARKGEHPGQQFWGCSAYPACRATLAYDGSDGSDESTPRQ